MKVIMSGGEFIKLGEVLLGEPNERVIRRIGRRLIQAGEAKQARTFRKRRATRRRNAS